MAAMIGAGCGSSTPIGAIFPAAYGATINAKSAKVTFVLDIKTATRELKSTGSGGIDWGNHQVQLSQSTATSGGAPVSTSEVIDGTDLYIAIPPAARSEVGGKPWVKVSLAQFEGSQGGGSGDPSQIMSTLNAQASAVTKVGTERVGGVMTTHYRALVDPAKAAPGASPAAKKLLAQFPALTGSSTLPIDVWIDSTGKARQLRYSITLTKPPAGASPAVSQGFPVSTTTTLGLSDYGTPVQVTVPSPDQVSTQTLSGLTGGAVGA